MNAYLVLQACSKRGREEVYNVRYVYVHTCFGIVRAMQY